jgi:hypothetical protein
MKVSKSYGRQSVEGNNLRETLSTDRTSCKEFAELMDVDVSTVYYWRYRGVSTAHVNAVADLLRVTPSWIASKRRNARVATKNARKLKAEKAAIDRLAMNAEKEVANHRKTEITIVTSAPTRKINMKLMQIVVDQKLTEEQEHVVFALAANFAEENAA